MSTGWADEAFSLHAKRGPAYCLIVYFFSLALAGGKCLAKHSDHALTIEDHVLQQWRRLLFLGQ